MNFKQTKKKPKKKIKNDMNGDNTNIYITGQHVVNHPFLNLHMMVKYVILALNHVNKIILF